VLLALLLLTTGAYSIVTNSLGTFCVDNERHHHHGHGHHHGHHANPKSHLFATAFVSVAGGHDNVCKLTWISKYTLPNQKNNTSYISMQQNINLAVSIIFMIGLIFFRFFIKKTFLF